MQDRGLQVRSELAKQRREFAKGSKSFCWRHGIDFAYVSDTPERKTWERKTTVCGKIRRIRSKIDT